MEAVWTKTNDVSSTLIFFFFNQLISSSAAEGAKNDEGVCFFKWPRPLRPDGVSLAARKSPHKGDDNNCFLRPVADKSKRWKVKGQPGPGPRQLIVCGSFNPCCANYKVTPPPQLSPAAAAEE